MSNPRDSTRRSFFGASAGAALLCTIGGEEVRVDDPRAARKADGLAARVKRPPGAVPQDDLAFPTPSPQPGGTAREYWIRARPVTWDVAPTRRDDWHDRPITGRRKFKALAYQLMQAGFAGPSRAAQIPGPTLFAEGQPPATPPRSRHASARTSPARDRDGRQLPRLPHPRAPLAGPGRRLRRHPHGGSERDDHRPFRRGQPGPLALPLPRLLAPGRRDG